MPIDLSRYPTNWRTFSAAIRFARARQQCECPGHCGLHQGRRCTERHGQPAVWARGRIHLTVAHLCSCDPPCAIPSHVIAACQRCHLRIDRQLHKRHRLASALATSQNPAALPPTPPNPS
jgi:hypothetical protein